MASRYDTAGIGLRIVNGDGAQWIQGKQGVKTIPVLNKYHRNKKITECAGKGEFVDNLRKLLYEGETDMVLSFMEAQINSLLPEESQKDIQKLRDMFGASKVPEREEHGYDYCHTPSLATIACTWLRELCRNMLRGSGNHF